MIFLQVRTSMNFTKTLKMILRSLLMSGSMLSAWDRQGFTDRSFLGLRFVLFSDQFKITWTGSCVDPFVQKKVKISKDSNGIYTCPETSCGFSSRKWNHAREHYKTHSGEKPFQCKLCDKKFSQKGTCINHIRTHDDSFKFKCSYCDSKFADRRYLKKHNTAEHGIVYRPYRYGRNQCAQM